MQITATTSIEPYEQKLLEDYIEKMKAEHPKLELNPEDIYRAAFRQGIDVVLDKIRLERREKMMEDWVRERQKNNR